MTSGERLVPATYVFGAVALVFTVTDWLIAAWPLQPGTVAWRFVALGLISNSIMMPMLTLLILLWVAAVHERLLAIRMVAALFLALGAVLLLSLPLFAMDALQLKATIQSNRQRSFEWTVARSTVKMVGGLIVCIWAGIAAWRLARSLSRKFAKSGAPSGLVAR